MVLILPAAILLARCFKQYASRATARFCKRAQEMFKFNASVMGYKQHEWMGEVLQVFDNMVLNCGDFCQQVASMSRRADTSSGRGLWPKQRCHPACWKKPTSFPCLWLSYMVKSICSSSRRFPRCSSNCLSIACFSLVRLLKTGWWETDVIKMVTSPGRDRAFRHIYTHMFW